MRLSSLFVASICLGHAFHVALSADLGLLNATAAASVSFTSAGSKVIQTTASDDVDNAVSGGFWTTASANIGSDGSATLKKAGFVNSNAEALNTTGSDNYVTESTISSNSSTPSWPTKVTAALSLMASRCQADDRCDGNVWGSLDIFTCFPCLDNYCSCDRSECPARQDCCLEVLLWNKWELMLPSQRPGCHSSRLDLMDSGNKNTGHFFHTPHAYYNMEASCPDSWTGDEEVVSKCTAFNTNTNDRAKEPGTDSQPVDDNDLLSGQWPVWSPVTKVTYRNMHCARCHGQDAAQIRNWDVSVNCKKGARLNYGLGDLGNLINEMKDRAKDCYLAFTPPAGTSAKMCKSINQESDPACASPSVYVDPTFGESCHKFYNSSGTTPINSHQKEVELSIDVNGANVSARTLFCAFCSKAHLQQHCYSPIDIDTPFPFVLVISFQALTSLHAELPNIAGSATAKSGRCSCALDEVYDVYESKCRKVYCSPMRKLDQQRRCVPFVERSEGLAYQFAVRLTPLSTNVTSGLPVILNSNATLLNAAFQIYEAVLRQTTLSIMDRFDMFRVWARMKRVNHEHITNTASAPGESGQQYRTTTVEGFDVKVKFVKTVSSLKVLEDRLMASVNSSWNFSVDMLQEARIYQATLAYIGAKIKEVGEDEVDDKHGEANGSVVMLVSSKDEHDEYLVDISDALVESYRQSHQGDVSRVGFIPDRYHTVQKSLMCSKVSFSLGSPIFLATGENDVNDPPAKMTDSQSRLQSVDGTSSLPTGLFRREEEGDGELAHSEDGTGTWRNTVETEKKNRRKGRKLVAQSVSEVSGEVILSLDLQTGWLYHHPSGRHIHFSYVEQLSDIQVDVCAEQLLGTSLVSDIPWEAMKKTTKGPLVLENHFSSLMIYLSVACQSLSTLCLFLALFTYCVFPELRTLPGKNNMGLIASLFVAMLLFEVGVARVEFPVGCVILGVAIHFSLLSGFTWMVLCSAHMYHVFTSLPTSRLDQARQEKSLFAKYVALSLLVPAAIVTLTLIGNWVAHREDCVLDLGYGRGICYLSNFFSLVLASILPICMAVLINLVLFAITLRSLRSHQSLSRDLLQTSQRHRRQLGVYVRMSTLTGINWLAGLFAAPFDSRVIWYLFVVLCGLQGLYIFVAFVCNKRVLVLYRALLCCGPVKTKKTNTLA